MNALQTLLTNHSITPEALLRASQQLESRGQEGRTAGQLRWKKRKTEPEKSYADQGLSKPASGRGLSRQQLQLALANQALPPRVRSKLTRALNSLLQKRGVATVEAPAVFGQVPVRRGAKPKGS